MSIAADSGQAGQASTMPIGNRTSADALLVCSEKMDRAQQTSAGIPKWPQIASSRQERKTSGQPEDGEEEGEKQAMALEGSTHLECNSSSSSDSDDLMEQLMGSRGVPVKTFSSLIDSNQPSGFSYLDPDFDIGIPSMQSLEHRQDLSAGRSRRQPVTGSDSQQGGPAFGLAHVKTCSDSEDCEVRRHLLVCMKQGPRLEAKQELRRAPQGEPQIWAQH